MLFLFVPTKLNGSYFNIYLEDLHIVKLTFCQNAPQYTYNICKKRASAVYKKKIELMLFLCTDLFMYLRTIYSF